MGRYRTVDAYGDSGEFGRLIDMVLAAQDFGLSPMDARAIGAEALGRSDSIANSCDWAAAALAERVLENIRDEVASDAGR
jgi:hypothetical protein